MKIEEAERPVPQVDEILVKMYASGVNPADYVVRQGGNEILKPFLKLPQGLGLDGAGEIEEIGSDVTGHIHPVQEFAYLCPCALKA
jgi:NADPH:quinone reductase-like Zn-dependent oxidoreductase